MPSARRVNTIRRTGLAALCALVFSAALIPAPALSQRAGERSRVDDLGRAVVRIESLRNGSVVSSGSGTVISADGLILTNRHVIENADDWRISIVVDVSRRPVPAYRASVVGRSDEVDFALLRVDAWSDGRPLSREELDLSFAVFAEEPLRVGDYIGVLGFPHIGQGFLTFTEGRVTTVIRGSLFGRMSSVAYQTDAELGAGNSGGFAFDVNGNMVGIPTAANTGPAGGRFGVITTLAAINLAVDAGFGGDPAPDPSSPRLSDSADATYGTTALAAGSMPRGQLIPVTAGGSVNAANEIRGCVGWVAAAPDYGVDWTGSANFLGFGFTVTGDPQNLEDTTLVVRTPAGKWICDDDGGEGLSPRIVIPRPMHGLYSVWIGTHGSGEYVQGGLYVLDSESMENPVDRPVEFPVGVWFAPGPDSAKAVAEAHNRPECGGGYLRIVADPRLAAFGVYVGTQSVPYIPPTGDPAADAGRALGDLIARGGGGRNVVQVYSMAAGAPDVAVYAGRTIRFGNAVKDACIAILAELAELGVLR